jgi:hypothetical protein
VDSPLSNPEFVAGLRPIGNGSPKSSASWLARDLVGVTPSGESIEFSLDDAPDRLLLVFLATNCDGCEDFWIGLQNPLGIGLASNVSVVVITKGPETVRASDVMECAVGLDGIPVIMSGAAWTDYQVFGYPFFVVVDAPTRKILGETVGFGWDDVVALTLSFSEY